MYALDPSTISNTDNDATIVTSNRLRLHSIASALCLGLPKAMAFANTHSITNMGATSTFMMSGIPMSTTNPVTIETEAQARIRPGKSQAKAKFRDF